MRNLSVLTAIFAAGLLAQTAGAATIINGSFELGDDPGGGFLSLGTGSTSITGWTVGGFGVDYIGGYWQASDGVRSVDLSGPNSGSIAQALDTVAGQTYMVGFDLSGNPDGGVGNKVSVATIGGSLPAIYTYTVGATNSRSNMNWQHYTYSFTAFSAVSLLTFASAEYSPYGPAIDNVSIVEDGGGIGNDVVPEPTSWAMMIAGFAMVGASARRRRPRSVTA
jgi:choice-of-anchor C domain-containing protein